jgi:replication factor C large subunit
MWAREFRPKKVEDMVGNEDARLTVVKWLTHWINGNKPLLLIGPPGTGKTSLVHALAQQFNYDLIEMNASDTRTRDDLEKRIVPILSNTSIFRKPILLFLDEIDGISSRNDTGGLEYLTKILKEPTIPVIIAANSKNTKIKELAKLCRIIEFKIVPPRLLSLFLEHILRIENKELSLEEKISIVSDCKGDIRSLLNIAQSRLAGYNAIKGDTTEIDIADTINGYFSSDSVENGKSFLSRSNGMYSDPRFGMSTEERRKDLINAFFSSIVASYRQIDSKSMAALLDVLSQADLIVGRAVRNRRWSLLKYLDDMISYGLYEYSQSKGIKYSQYGMIWPVMGPILARGQSMKVVISNLAQKAHMSRSAFGAVYLPYLIKVMSDNRVDPMDFALDSNIDEKVGEVLAKEMERISSRIRYTR